MLLISTDTTKVAGTDYIVEYTILKKLSNYTPGDFFEYGIRCVLYGKEKKVVSMEEIHCITPDFLKILEIEEILRRNQVFPVHLKEIVSDLIEIQLERMELPISA